MKIGQTKAKAQAFMRSLIAFIASVFEDILIFSGLGVITYATFLLSGIAGWYCLGACMLGLGIYFTRNPTRKG